MAYKLLIFLFGLHSSLTELAPGKTCFSNITYNLEYYTRTHKYKLNIASKNGVKHGVSRFNKKYFYIYTKLSVDKNDALKEDYSIL